MQLIVFQIKICDISYVGVYLGGPMASSMYGTVQLSSMMCPEMSSETRFPKLCMMFVRIFLVSLNLEER